MKSYRQYCGLARVLDVIGDRWSMLIVREVSLRDCRYTDIRDGLPGIATNLLAERLRSLTEFGVIERVEASAPVATPLYRLTRRGADLLPALHALVQWSSPLMVVGPTSDDVERLRWVAFAARAHIDPSATGSRPFHVTFACDGDVVGVAASDAGITVLLEPSPHHDLLIEGSCWHLMGVLSGEIPFRSADDFVTMTGAAAAKRRFGAILAASRTGQRR